MKVKELIVRLAAEDPEMRVIVDGYESGYDEVEKATFVYIKPKPNKNDNWWDGEFQETLDKNSEVALLLPRKS